MNIEEKIDLDMRLAKLEKSRENHKERLDTHLDYFSDLQKKIDKLETQQKYDHSNLVPACGRIEEIEKKLNYQQDAISQLNDIVTSNCTFKDHNTCKDKIDKLEKEIKELKRFQDITHLEYKSNTKPHKCPVCDGKVFTSNYVPIHCHSCEGKGIVWG